MQAKVACGALRFFPPTESQVGLLKFAICGSKELRAPGWKSALRGTRGAWILRSPIKLAHPCSLKRTGFLCQEHLRRDSVANNIQIVLTQEFSSRSSGHTLIETQLVIWSWGSNPRSFSSDKEFLRENSMYCRGELNTILSKGGLLENQLALVNGTKPI